MEMGEGEGTGYADATLDVGRLQAELKSMFEQESHTTVLPACLPSPLPPAVPLRNSPVCQLATCLVLVAQLSAAPLGPCLACQWAASASRHTPDGPALSPFSAGANGRPGKVWVTNENKINKSYSCTQEPGRSIFMAS